jgi:hypothetical protein
MGNIQPLERLPSVVRKREGLAAGFLLIVVQPLVEIQRVLGAHRRQGGQGHYLKRPPPVVSQNHVAVQVEALGNRCPLVADKSREAARFIEAVRCLDDILPHTVVDFRSGRVLFEKFPGYLHLGEVGDQVEGGLARGLAALLEALVPFLALRNRKHIGCPLLDAKRETHRVGMVCDHDPVQGSAQLYRKPGRRLYLFASREAVCVLVSQDVSEDPGV